MRCFLALFLVVAANALWVQMESDIQPWVPKGWTQLVDAPKPETIIKTTFALKHTDAQRAALDVALMAAADPQSPTYGEWLSIEDVTNFMAVPEEQIKIVTDYLESHGVNSYTVLVNRDMIQALIPIRTLESMLKTEFRTYVKRNLKVHRVIKPYFLPVEVASVVGVVEPLMRFPTSEPRVTVTENIGSGAIGNWPDYCGTPCHGKITPQVIQQQYKTVNVTAPSSKSSVAVAEFQGQQFDYNDLNGFASACGLKNYTVKVVGTNSEAHCQLYEEACIESLLDIEYLASLTQPIPITDYYDDTYSILDWANTVDADANAPFVHSVSYGNDEAQQTSVAYMNQCNDAFQKVTSRGITLLVASGDQGVWGREGTGTGHFNPDFPASSPYILAVGGSDLSTTSIGPETCCQDSGGGFSNTFARPSWQNTAVTNYLNTATLPKASLYNATGRGYPDVSAIFGLNIPYCIQSDGKFLGVAGTSASSPVAASVIALLNDIRFQKGDAPLGFANPFLYGLLATNPTAFNDITTGQNNGGFSTGFNAIAGWDPCSGLGTLNYANLKNLV